MSTVKKPNPSHAQPGTRLPTGFRATCKLDRWVPFEELLEIDPDATASHWDHKLECNVFLVRCEFKTEERAAFEAHMANLHGRKSTQRGVHYANKSSYGEKTPLQALPMWRPRRAPKSFDPTRWVGRDDVELTLLDEPAEDLAS